jgi:hypothetical protein
VTNELAISSPYEVTFRCFTPELAAVLTGFANSPYGIIVKGMNVETATTVTDMNATESVTPIAIPGPIAVQPETRPAERDQAFRSRYGRRAMPPPPTAAPTPVPYPVPGAAPVRTGLQTFLTEKQLKVTLLIHVVKLLPKT